MSHSHIVERPDQVLATLRAAGVAESETMGWLIFDLVQRGAWADIRDIAQAHIDLGGQ